MAREARRIIVTPGSEVALLLEAAAIAPVVLEKDGELYRLHRVENERETIWQGYDAKKVREAIKETAGSWADIDTDALIERIYRAREEGTRPADRP